MRRSLEISPYDPLDPTTIATKGWHLGTQINLHKHTYNLSRDTKKNSYSKRVEKADQYLKKIKKFKSNILPLSPHQSGIPYNEPVANPTSQKKLTKKNPKNFSESFCPDFLGIYRIFLRFDLQVDLQVW